jgi:hypothetical protein
MYDEAYLVEATIEAAERIKQMLWKKILELEKITFANAFIEILEIDRMNRYITYYSIMYGTHGV